MSIVNQAAQKAPATSEGPFRASKLIVTQPTEDAAKLGTDLTRKKNISSHCHMSSLRGAASFNSRGKRQRTYADDNDIFEEVDSLQNSAQWFAALTKGDRGRKHRGGSAATSSHNIARPSLRELTIAMERTQLINEASALPTRMLSMPSFYKDLFGGDNNSGSSTPTTTIDAAKLAAAKMSAQSRSSFMPNSRYDQLRSSKVDDARRNRVHALRLDTMCQRVEEFELPLRAQKRHARLKREENEHFVDEDGIDAHLRLFLETQTEMRKQKERESINQLMQDERDL